MSDDSDSNQVSQQRPCSGLPARDRRCPSVVFVQAEGPSLLQSSGVRTGFYDHHRFYHQEEKPSAIPTRVSAGLLVSLVLVWFDVLTDAFFLTMAVGRMRRHLQGLLAYQQCPDFVFLAAPANASEIGADIPGNASSQARPPPAMLAGVPAQCGYASFANGTNESAAVNATTLPLMLYNVIARTEEGIRMLQVIEGLGWLFLCASVALVGLMLKQEKEWHAKPRAVCTSLAGRNRRKLLALTIKTRLPFLVLQSLPQSLLLAEYLVLTGSLAPHSLNCLSCACRQWSAIGVDAATSDANSALCDPFADTTLPITANSVAFLSILALVVAVAFASSSLIFVAFSPVPSQQQQQQQQQQQVMPHHHRHKRHRGHASDAKFHGNDLENNSIATAARAGKDGSVKAQLWAKGLWVCKYCWLVLSLSCFILLPAAALLYSHRGVVPISAPLAIALVVIIVLPCIMLAYFYWRWCSGGIRDYDYHSDDDHHQHHSAIIPHYGRKAVNKRRR